MDFHLPKKKIFSAVLCGALMLSASVPAFAFSDSSIASSVFEENQMAVEQAAAAGNGADLSQSPYVLKRLGLVAGNDKGDLMLDKVGTRAEALTLFISMQGEQDEARAVDYSYPFTDIPDWFHWCAGYGVFRSYTSGISATKFGSFNTVTPEQYMTFTLKALDYKCGEDFTWDRSLDKAIEIGLCTRAQANAWKNGQFRRQEIMEISYLALHTKVKGGNSTLTDKLIAKGKITTEQARQESLTFGTAYQAQQEQNNASPITCTNVPDGSYELVSGNEMGALLLDYICAGRIEKGTMPKNPVAVKSIVSTPLADAIAAHYGVEMRSVLTGFKWIGDQIANLEAAGEVDRFIFGFEESYGYLAGPYVRDKDAVIGSMLICEMAAYYRSIGSSIKQRLEEIYKQYGRYLNKVDSFEFPGLTGMEKMASIMQKLRDEPLTELAGHKVVKVTDYKKPEETGLPAANVLIYTLDNGATVVVRPSGTEPKIKTYFTTLGKDLAEAQAQKDALAAAIEPILA